MCGIMATYCKGKEKREKRKKRNENERKLDSANQGSILINLALTFFIFHFYFLNLLLEVNMFLGIDMGFWYGLIVTGSITLTACLIAWLIPPKKKN